MPSKYGDLIAEDSASPQAAPEPQSKYGALIQEDEQDQSQALKQSFYVAAQKNPDKHAQVVDIANKNNVDPSFAESNFDALHAAAKENELDHNDIIRRHPKLAKFLENPDNAAVAQDDLEGLKKLEDHVNDHSLTSSLGDALNSGLASMYSSVAKVPAYVYDAMAIPQNIVNKALDRPQVQSPEWLRHNPVAEHYAKQAENLRTPEMEMSIFDEVGKGNYKRAGNALLSQVLANAPQQAMIIAGTLSGAGPATLAAAGLTTAADTNAQSQDLVGKPGEGADPLSASLNATYQGITESSFESLGTFGILNKWGKAIEKSYGKAAWHEVAGDISRTLIHSIAGEANEEFHTSWVQEMTDSITMGHELNFNDALKHALNAAAVGGLSGGIMTAPAATMTGLKGGAEHRKAIQAKEFYKAMGDGAEATKLRSRLPEMQRQYIEQLTKGSAVENIHIAPEAFETFFQGKPKSAAAVAGELGISTEYNEAKETGADIKVPLHKWVDKFAGSPEYGGLANDIKFGPDQLSVNEVKAEKERIADQLKAADKEAQKNAPEKERLTEESKAKEEQLKAFEDQLTEQLTSASTVYNKADAKKAVSLAVENLKVRAEIRGQTPEEILKADGGLTIQGANGPEVIPVQPGQGVLNQPARTLIFPVKQQGNLISVHPSEGMDASASFSGSDLLIDTLHTNPKYAGVTQDMIRSLEKAARAHGSTQIKASAEGLTPDVLHAYELQGFINKENVLIKDLKAEPTFNQSALTPAPVDEVTLKRHEQAREAEAKKFFENPETTKAYVESPETQGGKILDTDMMRELFEAYANNRALYNDSTSSPAGKAIAKLYEEQLKRPADPLKPIWIMGGGPGSGKSEMLKAVQHAAIDAEMIYDSVSSDFKRTKERIDQALKAGRRVEFNYVYNTLNRAMDFVEKRFKEKGRPVSSDFVAQAHVGALETALKLDETYAGNPDVLIQIYDNSKEGAPRPMSVDELRALRYTEPVDELVRKAKERLKDVDQEVQSSKERAAQDFAIQSRDQEAAGRNLEEESKSNSGSDGQSPNVKKFFQSSPAPAFYLKSAQLIESKMGNSATVEQVRAILKEVKEEERKWSGIDEFLKGKEKVTKAEILEFLRANQLEIKEVRKGGSDVGGLEASAYGDGPYYALVIDNNADGDPIYNDGPYDTEEEAQEAAAAALAELPKDDHGTKFSQYTLPGGENYREVLFVMPGNEYKLGHWDEEGVVAHVRLSDRTSITPASVEAEGNEARSNGLAAHAKTLADFAESKTFSSKRFSHLDAKRDKAVLDSVFAAVSDAKILGSIVELIPVDVMNDIAGAKLTPEQFLGDKSMLADSLTANPNALVKFRPSSLRTLVSAIADLATKESLASSDSVGLSVDGKATPKASGVGSGHREVRTLFVEEIQSDLHQAGRKKGYKGDAQTPKEFFGIKDEVWSKLDEAEKQAYADDMESRKGSKVNTSGVPDAPFRKTWHEFALKRIIRMAAEDGYDRVAWTQGEQQAERYDLSKSVDKIIYNKESKTIGVFKGQQTLLTRKAEINELDEIIGKEMAKKIADNPDSYQSYSGLDLKVGGEGMKGFYDKILVDFANKFGKKYGAKVGETHVVGGGADRFRIEYSPETEMYHVLDEVRDEVIDSRETEVGARKLVKRMQGKETAQVHSLDITPQLKEAALNEGFPLFQEGQSAPRGQIELKKHGALITLFTSQDFSTALHELGHYFLNNMQSDVAYLMGSPEASLNSKQKAFLKDSKTLLDWFGIESWDKLETKHHEMLAEGFEKYLMEGKAPSQRLQKAFNTFKVWLISIYNRARNIQVEISPDIKEVFNRMLATDEEIQKAQETQYAEPLFGRVGAYALSGAKAAAYDKAFAEAKEAASAAVTAKLMTDFEKTKSRIYKERRAGIRTKVEETVNATRIYRAIDILQKGQLQDGTPIKLSKSELINFWGAAGFEKIKNRPGPYLYAREGGLHPTIVAQLLGFENGDDLLTQIANAQDKKALIESETDRQMDTLYPDSLKDGALPQEAIDAVHNDKRADILRMELEHLLTFSPAVAKDIVKRMVRRVPSDKVVKEQARNILGSRSVEEVQPHVYLLAERKAAKSAGELLVKGDIDGAFESKQRELLNHELYRAALDARELIDKQLKKFKKLSRSDEDIAKSREVDLVNAARSILARFGLAKPDRTAESYLKQLKEYDRERYENIMALVESATERVGHYKEISFNDFVAMSDAVNAIYDLSKTASEIEIDGIRRDAEEVRQELQAQIAQVADVKAKPGYEKAVSGWDKTKMQLLGAKAGLTRIEHWVKAIDIDRNGPFSRYIWQPISKAVTNYRLEKEKHILEYKKILQEYAPRLTHQAIKADELGYLFKDKAELMMAILHSGNESNLDKLLRGRNWGDISQDGELDRSRWDKFVARMQRSGVLNKVDYEFAQKIWDLMDSMKPGAQKAHKLMYGYYFSEITANEIVTPWGTFKGGYIPAKVDLYTNEDAAIRQEREMFEQNNNSWAFPTTGRGFTKSRVQQYVAPLSLEMSLLAGHIDGVMRFTHIEPRIKEVMRIVSNKEFASHLAQVDPAIRKDAIVPWLERAATQKVVMPSQSGVGRLLDAVAKTLRTSMAMQLMVGNFVNAAQQLTGLVVAMSAVKPRHIIGALASYIGDIRGTTESVMDRSPFMRSTQGATIYDSQEAIKEILTNPSTFQNMKDFAKRHTYFLQSATQNVVNTVTWIGAYNQAIESGSTEAVAVEEADSAVRTTQGTNNPEDISRHEVGTATQRLFTQFTGFFNMLANRSTSEITRISREVGLKKGAGKMFYVYMTVFMIPAVLSEAMVLAASGRGFDDDDDGYLDDLLSLFFGSQFRTITAMVPYLGTTLNAATNRFNHKQYDDRLNLSPVVSTIESLSGVPAEVYNSIVEGSGDSKRAVKDVLMLMGIASSLPIGPVGKPVGYLMDVDSGKAEPTGPIDFTRGLVTGRSGK